MVNNSSLIYQRPENVTGTGDFFLSYTSTITGGLWGHIIVGIVFSVIFLSLTGYNSRQAFAAASFSAFVVTVMLASFGVVGTYLFTLTGLMVALSVVINRGQEAVGR